MGGGVSQNWGVGFGVAPVFGGLYIRVPIFRETTILTVAHVVRTYDLRHYSIQ